MLSDWNLRAVNGFREQIHLQLGFCSIGSLAAMSNKDIMVMMMVIVMIIMLMVTMVVGGGYGHDWC